MKGPPHADESDPLLVGSKTGVFCQASTKLKPPFQGGVDAPVELCARAGIHYGWAIFFLAGLLMLASAPGHTSGIGALFAIWMRDLRLTESQLSLLWMLATYISAALLIPAGWLVDIYGLRACCWGTLPMCVFTLVWMAHVQTFAEIGIGVVMCRFVNADLLTHFAMVAVNSWFVRHRGRASCLFVFIGGVNMLYPIGLEHYVLLFGWRFALQLCACATGFLVFVGAFLMRNHPRDVGLGLDLGNLSVGDLASSVVPGKHDKYKVPDAESGVMSIAVVPSRSDWTLTEASRSSVFWAILMGVFSTSASVSICYLHLFSLVRDYDLRAGVDAVYTISSLAFGIAGIFCGCVVIDRVSRPQIVLAAANCFGAMAIFILFFPHFSVFGMHQVRSILFAAVLGAQAGCAGCAQVVIFASLFGTREIAKFQAVVNAVGVVSCGLGPLVYGVLADSTGGAGKSVAVLIGFALLNVSSCAALMLARQPKK